MYSLCTLHVVLWCVCLLKQFLLTYIWPPLSHKQHMFTAVYILDPGPHTQCAYIIRTDVTQLVRMIQTQKWEGKCDLKPVLNSNFFKKTKTTWVDHMYNVIYHAKTPVYINSLALNRLQYALSKKWHAFSLIIVHDGKPLATLII